MKSNKKIGIWNDTDKVLDSIRPPVERPDKRNDVVHGEATFLWITPTWVPSAKEVWHVKVGLYGSVTLNMQLGLKDKSKEVQLVHLVYIM